MSEEATRRIPALLIIPANKTILVIVAVSAAVIVIAHEAGKEAQRKFIERNPSVLKIEQTA